MINTTNRVRRVSRFRSIFLSFGFAVTAMFGAAGTAQATTAADCALQTFELGVDTYTADYNVTGWRKIFYRWTAMAPLIGIYTGMYDDRDEVFTEEQGFVGRYESVIGRFFERGVLDAANDPESGLLDNAAELGMCIADIGKVLAEDLTGYYTLVSDETEREYYLSVPDNYDPDANALPMLIMIHGSGDSIQGWMEGGFQGPGLLNLAKQDAIVIIPNGLVGENGKRSWDSTSPRDYNFFLDLLAALEQNVVFDYRRIFVTGHSAGALMTNGLGCRYGDIFRAIAPSAGSLTDVEFNCTGSVGVVLIQGEFDAIQTPGFTAQTRDDWAQYNGYGKDIFSPVDPAPCVDHSAGSLLYPMVWCLHGTRESQGHAWWPEADQAIWDFFTRLDIVEPTAEPPPNGGNDKVVREPPDNLTTLTVAIDFPEGVGEPLLTGLYLYPENTPLPISGAPLGTLNPDVALPDVSPGARTVVIPVNLPDESKLPQTYTMVMALYISGTFPQPTPFIDHNLLYELTIEDSTSDIVIPGVQPLLPIQP